MPFVPRITSQVSPPTSVTAVGPVVEICDLPFPAAFSDFFLPSRPNTVAFTAASPVFAFGLPTFTWIVPFTFPPASHR